MPPEFRPGPILAALVAREVELVLIGGLAALSQGSPFPTEDVDITPHRSADDLVRLSSALGDLGARIRADGVDEGLPFGHDATSLASVGVWNPTTRHGGLHIAMVPTGTDGYEDLNRGASEIEAFTVAVRVASLGDVIRSKQAANRPKDSGCCRCSARSSRPGSPGSPAGVASRHDCHRHRRRLRAAGPAGGSDGRRGRAAGRGRRAGAGGVADRGDRVPVRQPGAARRRALVPAVVAVLVLLGGATRVRRAVPRVAASVAAGLVGAVAVASVVADALAVVAAVVVSALVAAVLARRSGEDRRAGLLPVAIVMLLLLEVWPRADEAGRSSHDLGFVGLLLGSVAVATALILARPGSGVALAAGWLAVMVVGSLVADVVQNENDVALVGSCPGDVILAYGRPPTPVVVYVVVVALAATLLAAAIRAERRSAGASWLAVAILALLPAGLLHAALDHDAAVAAAWVLVALGAGLLLLDRRAARRRTDKAVEVPEPVS